MRHAHNRNGSVLLMAIGLLTILAILASTFLVVSNLDSEETQSLQVVAYADPLVEGVLAKAIADIGRDRYSSMGMPYGSMQQGSVGFVQFIDCPHDAYDDTSAFPNPEYADTWLASSYIPNVGFRESHFSNLNGETATNDPKNYKDQQFSQGATADNYIDTDGDGTVDAYMVDTGIPVPGMDANDNNHYFVAARIVDLGSRINVNTAGGGFWPTDPVYTSGPAAVDLRDFLDNQNGGHQPLPAENGYVSYNLLNVGNRSRSDLHGRVGTAGNYGVDATLGVTPGSLAGYSYYCGRNVLAPAPPVGNTQPYEPYGVGEEPFFLNACNYQQNPSQFAGRINNILLSNSVVLQDNTRRQLTASSSVSNVVRWQETGLDAPLAIESVQSQADCEIIYARMKLMLQKMGIGRDATERQRMAAHFAANLWAYCANGPTGEPWAFRPQDNTSLIAYGLQQDLVITQVLARHIQNSLFDPNDKDKDDSAWGYAIELGNPTSEAKDYSKYRLEIQNSDGTKTEVTLGGGNVPATASNASSMSKRVFYNFEKGPSHALTEGTFFGASFNPFVWRKATELNLLLGTESAKIVLYRLVNGESVPVDMVTIGDGDNYDLNYKTSLTKVNVAGDVDKKVEPDSGDYCVYIRRDDRIRGKTLGSSFARYNLAEYDVQTPPGNGAITNTTLGTDNGLTSTDALTHCTYGTKTGKQVFGPGIYRPRAKAVSAPPTTREGYPTDEYYLPSIAEMANVFLTGPERLGTGLDSETTFTTGILADDKSQVFSDRADRGRVPSVDKPTSESTDDNLANYPDIPPAYMFYEFFSRVPGHQARIAEKERRRLYGMMNINTLTLPTGAGVACAAYWLPWPKQTSSIGSSYDNSGNRMQFGGGAVSYSISDAIDYLRKYRNAGPDDDRKWVNITGLRELPESKIEGFLTPGEVGVALAKYCDEKLYGISDSSSKTDTNRQDADYVRARNALFSYIADSISTRSDVFACYITIQAGKDNSENGRRWRYVSVIDRSNVLTPQDKAAMIMLTQMP